jgi:type III restriction enzyme
MNAILLQRMLDNLPAGSLPPNWRGFDLASFSRDKTLWDYQQDALAYALKALWQYYRQPGLSSAERKAAYYQWYRDFGLDEDLDIPIDKSSAAKRRLAALQEEYFISVDDKLPFDQFINSICLWMATGSGKTLVIVKLIEILHGLIQRGEIPNHDILILAHRDDLLEQLAAHIAEYNTTGEFYIRLVELREYSEVKRAAPNLFAGRERSVFYYRSDNLSDEQKEKIVDFRNYDNHGRWYILLDEAHKGDREDSKRQQIYAILARQGFLFNFSATFTDRREVVTTAYNFNLSEFIRRGYGKHIYIFDQDTTAFRRGEDFTESEKQKIVLKALMLLAHLRGIAENLHEVDSRLYHRPLLMALVNSVNTQDADLKLLFRELVRIANGEIDEGHWSAARDELVAELAPRPSYVYEPATRLKVDIDALRALTQSDLLRAVFNSKHPCQVEILLRPSNRKEIAFKLKTSDEPFALIRIGDISNWLTQELAGYEVNQRFDDEGFFERLNTADSRVNLLLGSRSFYEGWDSNRPNVIMYINIGTGTDAKKFILQSVGRGARIEPLPGYRQRFRELYTSGSLKEDEEPLFHQVKEHIQPLESEFIFGTNRDALETVISELDQEDEHAVSFEISLHLNQSVIGPHRLLIPVFRQQEKLLYHQRELAKFPLSPRNLDALQRYLAYVDDDRPLLALHGLSPRRAARLRTNLAQPEQFFNTDGPHYKNIPVLVGQVDRFFSLFAQELEKFKPLEDEINHHQHVRVYLPEVEFEEFSKHLAKFYEQPKKIAELQAKYNAQQLPFEEITRQLSALQGHAGFAYRGQEVQFKRIQQHYYLPLLVSEDARLEYLRSVINVESEVRFLKKLEDLLAQPGNIFEVLDWWLFSRIDETRDHINIPYYYPVENRMASFRPDFIFWLQKGEDYRIVFVDPKGTSRTEYQYKVDGFRDLFEKDGQPIVFEHEGLRVTVRLFLFTNDRAWSADYYRRYWLDNVADLVG